MNFESICVQALGRIDKMKASTHSPIAGMRPSSYAAVLDMKSGTAALNSMSLGSGASFFLGVLRSFSMTPAERKKMEAAARFFGVNSKRFSLPKENWEGEYQKYWDKLREMYGTACKIIQRGEACRDDQFCTARCFRIVNTGGFSPAVMKEAQRIVDLAAASIDEAGFGALCYGDVYITNTVMRRSSVLAMYMIHEDRMYVRANLKNFESEAVSTIIHELGHRLEHRFMNALDKDKVRVLYQQYSIADKTAGKARVEGGRAPNVGDIFVYKKENFRVERVGYDKVYLRGADPEIAKATITMPLETWFANHGGKVIAPPSAFPTAYAKTNPSEFFAEMFSFALLDKLNAQQNKTFDPIMESLATKLHEWQERDPEGLVRQQKSATPGLSRSRKKRRRAA